MVIVSLTTTCSRLNLCRYTLMSLCNQAFLPDRIILWLSRDSYLRDEGVPTIPAWLEEICRTNPLVEIRWTKNTGPYRKLLPVLLSCADDDEIVTADDDIIYGENWLGMLIRASRESPQCIAAGRVRRICRNVIGKEITYLRWPIVTQPGLIDEDAIVTFGGGAVVKKSFFKPEYLQDDAYMQLAPTADDLWYSKLLALHGISVMVVPAVLNELFFIIHSEGLTNENCPPPTTWWQRVKVRQKERFLGRLGFSICGNDRSYKKIQQHFAHGRD